MTQGLWCQPLHVGGHRGIAVQALMALTVGTGHRISPEQAANARAAATAEEGVVQGLPLPDRGDLQCAHVVVLEPPMPCDPSHQSSLPGPTRRGDSWEQSPMRANQTRAEQNSDAGKRREGSEVQSRRPPFLSLWEDNTGGP